MEALAHDIPESQQILRLGKTKLYAEIDAGRLTVFKVGRKTLIARAELERYVAERMAEARASRLAEAA